MTVAIIIVAVVVAGVAYLAYISAPQPTPVTSTFPRSTSTCASSQISTTSTSDSAVFNLETMPSNFTVGNYRFVMVYNGTGYASSSNGSATTSLGYSLVFNITQGSQSQTVTFGSAPPAPYPPSVPIPSTATAFDGIVHMQWVATCTGIFFEITIQPAFITGTSVNSSTNTFFDRPPAGTRICLRHTGQRTARSPLVSRSTHTPQNVWPHTSVLGVCMTSRHTVHSMLSVSVRVCANHSLP